MSRENNQENSNIQNLAKMGLNTHHFPSLTNTLPTNIFDNCVQSQSETISPFECSVEKKILQHTLEALQDIYIVIDMRRKKLVRWNTVLHTITGWNENEEISLQSIFSTNDIEELIHFPKNLSSNTVGDITLHLVCKRGEKIPIKFTVSSKEIYSDISYIIAIGKDIRSDVASTKKLIESRNKYESIFNSTDDGIIVFDPISGVVDSNRAAVELFQYKNKEELQNTSFLTLSSQFQMCNTTSAYLFKQYLEDIIHFGTKVFKWKFVRANNEEFPANVAISKFIYDEKTLFNARITDISLEQKRLELLFMERNLSIAIQSEGTTRSILIEAIDHLLTLSDIDAGVAITWTSLQSVEIITHIGIKESDLTQLSTLPFSKIANSKFPIDESLFLSSDDTTNRYGVTIGDYPASIWLPLIYNDTLAGIILLFSKNVTIMNQEMKSAIDIVTGIIHNAVIRCKAEDELRSSEERHRNLVENAPYGIFVSNYENEILDVNSAACKLTSLSKEQLLSKNFIDLIAVEKRNLFKDSMQKLFLNGIYFGEYPTDDKEERFWSINSVKTSDKSCLSFVMDTSKIKELENRINQKEKMEAIGQLAGGIAHDFNNQLTGIIGYSELLKDELKSNDQLQEYVDYILTATKRSSEITSQLLAYARKGKYITKSVDIHTIINEVIDLLKHTIDKRILLKQVLNAESSMVLGDASQLQNMFLNLAINARDAMPDGGELIFTTSVVTFDVAFKEEKEYQIKPGTYIKISVKDSGSGMNPETQKRVFEPFFTTKAKGKGTGMGLAAVYGTVKNHKGYIKIESEIDLGTEFHIYIPKTKESAQTTETIEILEKADHKVYGTGHILIVDDDELICNTLSNSLSKLGYKTDVCYNGLDAIDFYKSNWMSINLIILDMVMPLLSGKDTFYELKKINENCKVVLSSGFTSDADVTTLLQAGAKKFVQKPYSITNISSVVYDLLHV